MKAAVRQQQYRGRQRAGLVVFPVVANEVDAEAMLIRAGLLDDQTENSRDAIADALGQMIERLCDQPA
jgi:hypothetical protein